MRADQEKVKTLLRDTITLLCRNGLLYDTELKIEGVIGITVNKNDVFIVHINETIADNQMNRVNSAAPAVLPDSRSAPFSNVQEEFEDNSCRHSNHNFKSFQHSDESTEQSNSGPDADVMLVKTEGGNLFNVECGSNNLNNTTNQCAETSKLSTAFSSRKRKRSSVKPVSTLHHPSKLGFSNHSGSAGFNQDVAGFSQISKPTSSATWQLLDSIAVEPQSVNQTPSNRAMGLLLDDYTDSFDSPSGSEFKHFLGADVLSPQATDGYDESQLMDQTDGGARGTFVCEFTGCGLSFVHSYTLYRHQRVKHGRRHGAVQQQLYYCPVDLCGKVFCREGTLSNHIRDVHANHGDVL